MNYPNCSSKNIAEMTPIKWGLQFFTPLIYFCGMDIYPIKHFNLGVVMNELSHQESREALGYIATDLLEERLGFDATPQRVNRLIVILESFEKSEKETENVHLN